MKNLYASIAAVFSVLGLLAMVGGAFGLDEAASSLPKRAYLVEVANDEPRPSTPAATPTESSQTERR